MSLWKGANVLVTGGAGCIGSCLSPRLLELGANVRIIDNLERGKLEYIKPIIDKVEFLEEDLRDRATCDRACKDIDVVFHLASKVGGIGYYLAKPGEVLTQNLLIDTHVLEASVKAGVSRYLFASSAHVYPIELQMDADSPPIHEDQDIPAHPELSYGWAKLVGEKELEFMIAEGHKIRGASSRIVGAYGPNQDIGLATGSAIPVFCRRAIEYPDQGPFTVLGTGKETRSYIYIDDVIDALILSVEKLDNFDLLPPLNIGNEGRITIGEIAEKIIDISGKDINIEWDRSHPTTIWGQAPDCQRAMEILDGWKPSVSFDEGLRKIYAHVEERLNKQA